MLRIFYRKEKTKNEDQRAASPTPLPLCNSPLYFHINEVGAGEPPLFFPSPPIPGWVNGVLVLSLGSRFLATQADSICYHGNCCRDAGVEVAENQQREPQGMEDSGILCQNLRALKMFSLEPARFSFVICE